MSRSNMFAISLFIGLSSAGLYDSCVQNAQKFGNYGNWFKSLKLGRLIEKKRSHFVVHSLDRGKSNIGEDFCFATRLRPVQGSFSCSITEEFKRIADALEKIIPSSPAYDLHCYIEANYGDLALIAKKATKQLQFSDVEKLSLVQRLKLYLGVTEFHQKAIQNRVVFATFDLEHIFLIDENLTQPIISALHALILSADINNYARFLRGNNNIRYIQNKFKLNANTAPKNVHELQLAHEVASTAIFAFINKLENDLQKADRFDVTTKELACAHYEEFKKIVNDEHYAMKRWNRLEDVHDWLLGFIDHVKAFLEPRVVSFMPPVRRNSMISIPQISGPEAASIMLRNSRASQPKPRFPSPPPHMRLVFRNRGVSTESEGSPQRTYSRTTTEVTHSGSRWSRAQRSNRPRQVSHNDEMASPSRTRSPSPSSRSSLSDSHRSNRESFTNDVFFSINTSSSEPDTLLSTRRVSFQ